MTERERKPILKADGTPLRLDDLPGGKNNPHLPLTDDQLREFVVSTMDHLLGEALARFEGARRNQSRTPAQMRVLIATADIPQHLRTMLAAEYSETYE